MINRIIHFLKSLTEKQIVLLLIAITFGFRLYAVLMAKGIAYDSTAYGFIARDLLAGHWLKGLSSPLHPLYPFLIFLVSPGPHSVEIAGRFVSFFWGVITVIPLYYLIKDMIGQRTAALACLFYSIHPYLVSYSGMMLSEATYWGLLTWSVYLFWMGLKAKQARWMVPSGIGLALAYLARPEGIGYLFVYVVWIIFYGGLKTGWFRKFVLVCSLAVPICILISPYLIHLHKETGQWVITKKGLSSQSQILGIAEEKKESSSKSEIAAPPSEGKPFKLLRVMENLVRFLPFTAYHYLRAFHFGLWLLLIFGLIRTRREEWIGELFLGSLVLFHLFSLSTFTHSTVRFSVPVIPLSLCWAGAGVFAIQDAFKKIKIRNPETWAFYLVLFFILVQLPQSLKPERTHRSVQKDVGLWLKQNTPTGNRLIMSNSPIEAFYAEKEFVFLPPEIAMDGMPAKSYTEIIQFARAKRVNYILINKYTHEFDPDFQKSIQPADLKECYRVKEKDGNIIVYEVVY
jgi:hypothetical protein